MRRHQRQRRRRWTVNNVYAIMRAVQSGAGIGALPEFMVSDGNDLVNVLPDWRDHRSTPISSIPRRCAPRKRTAVFRDFLLRKVAESKLLTRGSLTAAPAILR